MAMQKIYKRINWENLPSEKTPLDEINLNKMDKAIDDLDDRIIAVDNAVTNTGGVQIVLAYIRSFNLYGQDWLSASEGGPALTPNQNTIYVVMTDGLYSRLMYMFDGSKYFPIGHKVNVEPALPDIVHEKPESVTTRDGIELMRFRPADTTDKISVRFNFYVGAYGGGFRCGILNETYREYSYGRYAYNGVMEVTHNATVGTKENDFIFVIGNGQAFSSSTCSDLVVTEMSSSNNYVNTFAIKNRLIDSMPGLVPRLPGDFIGDGVFMSDGKWHTLDELKEMLGIGSQP